MNGKDLLDKMSDVDPELIVDAEKQPRKKKRGLYIGITSGMAMAAAAAVLAVAIGSNHVGKPPIVVNSGDTGSDVTSGGVGINSGSNSGDTSVPKDPLGIDFSGYEHLPKISYFDLNMVAMGEPVRRDRVTKKLELESHSPWSADAELKTLPVYISYSVDPDIEKMREYVRAAAAALGISEDELEISDNIANFIEQLEMARKSMEKRGASEDEIERETEQLRRMMFSTATVYGKADGVSIDVGSIYDMRVSFDEKIKLPEGCRLGKDAAESEDLAAVEYLADKFKDLIGYENPVIGRCSEYDDFYYGVYDASGELGDRIANFSIKFANFIENDRDSSEMSFLNVRSGGNLKKFGDYPIYTAAQAEELIKTDKFSDDERMPADAKIIKTDIVYSNRRGLTAVLPYYKFYVETDTAPNADDEVMCDIYMICAVPEQFIDIQVEDLGLYAF